MIYFYRIGCRVLISDKPAQSVRINQSGEYENLAFGDDATIKAVKGGDIKLAAKGNWQFKVFCYDCRNDFSRRYFRRRIGNFDFGNCRKCQSQKKREKWQQESKVTSTRARVTFAASVPAASCHKSNTTETRKATRLLNIARLAIGREIRTCKKYV